MYDKFQPFQELQKQNFTFQPLRYEIWVKGKMVKNGHTSSMIKANVVMQNSSELVEVLFSDENLNDELASRNIFDKLITANDRLQLVVIPQESNSENMGIMMFKMIIGATRKNKHFNNNQPYCCNLFLQNNTLTKITFSFSNQEKLIEFYS